MSAWKLGEFRQVGRKLYGRCERCGGIVRVNKPIIGDLHICAPDEVNEAETCIECGHVIPLDKANPDMV